MNQRPDVGRAGAERFTLARGAAATETASLAFTLIELLLLLGSEDLTNGVAQAALFGVELFPDITLQRLDASSALRQNSLDLFLLFCGEVEIRRQPLDQNSLPRSSAAPARTTRPELARSSAGTIEYALDERPSRDGATDQDAAGQADRKNGDDEEREPEAHAITGHRLSLQW